MLQFPWYLDVVALVLGGAAFLMATQPFIAMIWGRAKIKALFEVVDQKDEHALMCLIFNEPITKGPLSLLGVKRDHIEDLAVHVQIDQRRGGDLSIGSLVPITSPDSTVGYRVRLPAAEWVAKVAVVLATKAEGQTYGLDDGENTKLPAGQYEASVVITADGKRTNIKKGFRVSENRLPYVAWHINSS